MAQWWLGACLSVLALSCADNQDTAGGVSGKWCGRDVASAEACVGDEVEYLDLVQSGSTVTGKICEAYEADCAPIENGKLSGAKLTLGFDPQDVGGLADLELSGDVLDGTLHSDKCACELPFTFHRL
ncbi:MAG: hypothetical protein ABUL60_20745 [Myxococcales bacterium]